MENEGGADIGSDHYLIVAKFIIKLKAKKSEYGKTKRIYDARLKNDSKRE